MFLKVKVDNKPTQPARVFLSNKEYNWNAELSDSQELMILEYIPLSVRQTNYRIIVKK